MALKFRINEVLIAQVKQCVEQFGVCYLTGCGNMYTEARDAETKRMFTNPDQEEATFLVKFKKGDKIPSTPKEMEEAFYEARKQEISAANNSTIQVKQNVLKPIAKSTEKPGQNKV